MANPIFYFRSIADATITVTDEATGFPKENLQDLNEHTIWKANDANGKNINIDFGSAISADFVVVGGNNFTAIGAWMKVYYSDNGSSYTQANGTITSPNTTQVILFSSESHRYWRVTAAFESPPGSAAAEVATIYIGLKWQPPIRFVRPFRKGYGQDVNLVWTPGGQGYSNQNSDLYKLRQFRFVGLDGQTALDDLEDFLANGNLNADPFYWDEEGDGNPLFYRMLNNPMNYAEDRYLLHSTGLFLLRQEL